MNKTKEKRKAEENAERDKSRLESIHEGWEKLHHSLMDFNDHVNYLPRKLENKTDATCIKFIRDLIDELFVLKNLYSQLTEKEKIEYIRREKALGKLYSSLS